MAAEPLAIRPDRSDEDDYRNLCATLEGSARGRAFLTEHAQRNRNADTDRVLGALDRLAAQMRADAAGIAQLRVELRALLSAMRPAAEAAPDEHAQSARPALNVVPPPDEPELPIPSPFVAQPPAVAIVPAAERPPPSTAVMPEVNVFDSAPAAVAKPLSKASARPGNKATPLPADLVRLLAPIMALSEDERLALFT